MEKKFTKAIAFVMSAVLVGLFGTAEYYSQRLPQTVTAETADDIKFAIYPELKAEYSADCASVSLFGAIPVKNISVKQEEAPTLVACGNPFGIKLLMEGVMVTGMSEVDNICPAENAGIQKGDIITVADNQPVTSNSDLQKIISKSKGKSVELSVNRGGDTFTAELKPVYSRKDNSWRGGMWVRDSIAGIGTMTFIDKSTGKFAGLGHPVCDSDTGELIPIHSGEAVPVDITESRKGQAGIPGELHGQFTRMPVYGMLTTNNDSGVFGILSESAVQTLCNNANEYKMGYRQDITTGEAYILTTVSGNEPKKYSVQIEQIDYSSNDSTKNMVISITDEELIKLTGGIVQGMSGSPIIQNDKIIGAVTHVFIADPTRGYAVFAETMFDSITE